MKPSALDLFVATRPYPDAIDARLVSAQRSIATDSIPARVEYRTLRNGLRKPYRSSSEQRLIAKLRRDELVAEGRCINGHGKATHGVLCARCRKQHRRSA